MWVEPAPKRGVSLAVPYNEAMILTSLAAVILGQTLSENASVIYTGFPALKQAASIRLVSLSASGTVEKQTYAQEVTVVLKNTSDKEVVATITVPVHGQNVSWPMLKEHRVSATVDQVALTLARSAVTTEPDISQKDNGRVYGTYQASHDASVTFKPGQTRALRTRFVAPLGAAGLDGMQRLLVFETAGKNTWQGTCDQFNYALKYEPSVVFNVFAALPKAWGWQVGTRGAFVKRTPFTPEAKSLVVFTFYPNGFDRIGG